jgi:hypothetical protein
MWNSRRHRKEDTRLRKDNASLIVPLSLRGRVFDSVSKRKILVCTRRIRRSYGYA